MSIYYNFFRFVNMVTTFGFEDGKLLDHIKTARTNISKELKDSQNCLVFFPENNIKKNNEFLFQQLNLSDWSFVEKDLSQENINTAARMFLNLNACRKADNLKQYFKALYIRVLWEFKGTYSPLPRPLKEVILSSLKIFHETSTGDNKTIARTFQNRLNTIFKGKGFQLHCFVVVIQEIFEKAGLKIGNGSVND